MSVQRQIGAMTALYNDGGLRRLLRKRWNFFGRCRFVNRSRGTPGLVLILAGYKPALWPMVFPRFKQFLPAHWDVCLVIPGKQEKTLLEMAARYGWSTLSTSSNKLGLAQNHAIRLHPRAEMICKLDEDIFISSGFLEGLVDTLQTSEEEGLHRPGFVAPVLNVNGFTSRYFLEAEGKLGEFEERFGRLPFSCTDSPVWQDPEAAAFLWNCTFPFDEVAGRFFRNHHTTSVCHHRFSIGAILFRREVWDAMQGFNAGAPGILGADESDLCAWCVEHSRAMLVAHRVLAGHAGFQNQLPRLIPMLVNREDLALNGNSHSDP